MNEAPPGAGDTTRGGGTIERLIERVGGLDVHKPTVAVCVRVPGSKGTRAQHVRTFGTTAAELLALRDWLEAHGVTYVAMESTAVYWKPIYYVLEEHVTCLLVNAAHVKQVSRLETSSASVAVAPRWVQSSTDGGRRRRCEGPQGEPAADATVEGAGQRGSRSR